MDDEDEFERARRANLTNAAAEPKPGGGVWFDAGGWVEADIPKRPWVVQGFLLRGSVTMAAGAGGAGKSSLMCGWAVSLALGLPYGKFVPPGPVTVVSYAVEDDCDELHRRLSATLRQFGKSPDDLEKRLVRCGPMTVGTLIERDPVTGTIVLTNAWDSLVALITARKPAVLIMDPFVELHTTDENDNTAVRLVMARLRELAHDHDCAIVLVHHTRKGGIAGDADSVRGAGSIIGAVRVAITVTQMTAEEAMELGQSVDLRRSYFRVDMVKQNYASGFAADWHVLHEYDLDNGETAAAAVPWSPPDASRPKTDPDVLLSIRAQVEVGCDAGPYSPRLQTDQPRSVAAVMARHGITSPKRQKDLLGELLRDGFEVAEYRDENSRVRSGLRGASGTPKAVWIRAKQPGDLL